MKIPFDLHAAIDGKPVINGMGESFHFDAYHPNWNYPVVGHTKTNGAIQGSFTKDGRTYKNEISDYDLYMKPEKITRWILVNSVVGFDTKEKAFNFYKNHTENDSSLIKVEFCPGEGIHNEDN